MKLHIFVAFNAYLGCSGQPVFDDHEPDIFAQQVKRRMLTGEPEKVFPYENVSWYHVADYDDETMKMESLKEPVLLVRCSEILDQRKIKEKMIEDAKKKEVGGDTDVSN